MSGTPGAVALRTACARPFVIPVAAQLRTLSYSGICGPLNFGNGPVPGVAIINPVGVQWKKGKQFPYEMVVVDNSLNPSVPIGGPLEPTNA